MLNMRAGGGEGGVNRNLLSGYGIQLLYKKTCTVLPFPGF